MMKLLKLICFFLVTLSVTAQEQDRFYATMAIQDALELKKDLPNEIEILETKRNEAAVYMSPTAGHELHDRILVHGPGYIFKATRDQALQSIGRDVKPVSNNRMAFSITEDAVVNETLGVINTQNIENHILQLENYGTRYHNRPSATQAANDLKLKWETMAATYGRTDVSVRLFNHVNTNMPSVIMTIEGADNPDEFVIVGGHLDSTANPSNNDAPGADDDASGIATMTEAVRSLFEVGFVPKKSIEVMAYAAEEIGLVGSAEIAQEYSINNIDVVSVVQFDMTNYNGSANDVSFITDHTDGSLNAFLMQLADHYNNSGPHQISYGTSICNYGCSDHASWTNEGFMASFPFEASFGQHNPNIHTSNDTYSLTGTADHATKFAKLCVEYLVETAKSSVVLTVDEPTLNSIFVTVENGTLFYDLSGADHNFTGIELFDMQGRRAFVDSISDKKGLVSLQELSAGVYVVSFSSERNTKYSKKIVLK